MLVFFGLLALAATGCLVGLFLLDSVRRAVPSARRPIQGDVIRVPRWACRRTRLARTAWDIDGQEVVAALRSRGFTVTSRKQERWVTTADGRKCPNPRTLGMSEHETALAELMLGLSGSSAMDERVYDIESFALAKQHVEHPGMLSLNEEVVVSVDGLRHALSREGLSIQ